MADTQAEYYRGLEAGAAARAAAVRAGGDAADVAAAAHAAANALFAPAADAPPRACAAGCAHCCHFPVGVRHGEALLLARAVAEDAALAAAVQAEAHATAGLPWAELVGRPCPLLRAGRCSVYAARPTPCRALASAEAEACAEALRGTLRRPLPRDEAAWWRGLGLAAALGADGDGAVRELRSAVAAVLAAGADGVAAAFTASRPAP